MTNDTNIETVGSEEKKPNNFISFLGMVAFVTSTVLLITFWILDGFWVGLEFWLATVILVWFVVAVLSLVGYPSLLSKKPSNVKSRLRSNSGDLAIGYVMIPLIILGWLANGF